jgi:hypothetical protein
MTDNTRIDVNPAPPPITYPDIYSEIKGGIWAVGLTFVVLWVATKGIRATLILSLTKVIDAHILTLTELKSTTKDTNEVVHDIEKIVKELEDKWD